jgi:hypothetical protein
MVEFFEALRTDRKLDESLTFIERIEDPNLRGRLQAVLALAFVNVAEIGALLSFLDSTQSGVTKRAGQGSGSVSPDEPPNVVSVHDP